MVHDTVHVGLYVIFGIIMLPVYVMIVGWFVGKPRDFRTLALTFVYVFSLLIAIVFGLLVLDAGVSLLVPY